MRHAAAGSALLAVVAWAAAVTTAAAVSREEEHHLRTESSRSLAGDGSGVAGGGETAVEAVAPQTLADDRHRTAGGHAEDNGAGPTALSSYCAQGNGAVDRSRGARSGPPKFVERQRVEGDWLGFGVSYDAVVTGVNADGTYNLRYDDGFVETSVPPDSIKAPRVGPENFDPSQDPACKMEGGLETVDSDLARVHREIGEWLAKRQRRMKDAKAKADVQVDPTGVRDIENSVRKIATHLEEVDSQKKELVECHNMDSELSGSIEILVLHKDELLADIERVDAAAVAVEKAIKASPSTAGSAADQLFDRVRALGFHVKRAWRSVKRTEHDIPPSGDKWWRYRYEYSYVEAMVLMFLAVLAFLFQCAYGSCRRLVRFLGKEPPFERLTEDIDTLFVSWLDLFAGELLVGASVVQTVWLLSRFGLFDLPLRFAMDSELHLPTEPGQYRSMAVRTAVELSIALSMYFLLMLPVVGATVAKVKEWNMWSETLPSIRQDAPPRVEDKDVGVSRSCASIHCSIDLAGSNLAFQALAHTFADGVRTYPQVLEELQAIGKADMVGFPFAGYLCIRTRRKIQRMLEMRPHFWVSVLGTVIIFALLHRFAHMGYVRIMSFFAVVLVLTLLGMACAARSITQAYAGLGRLLPEGSLPAGEPVPGKAIASGHSTEFWVASVMQYTLFFLCYGFVRMVAAQWMWELYYYNVLALTMIFTGMLVLFAFVVSPLVPVFHAAMSLPPNINEHKVWTIIEIMKERSLRRSSGSRQVQP